MLAPRPAKLRSQRDINLWRIPFGLALAAVALFGVTLIPDILDKYEVIHNRWYHGLLHNNRGAILRTLLRLRGGSRVAIVNTPFYLR